MGSCSQPDLSAFPPLCRRMQGYYRRADASMVLGKHKDALRDFKQAQKGAKADPDLKRKLMACQKELQRQRFADAVSSAPPSHPRFAPASSRGPAPRCSAPPVCPCAQNAYYPELCQEMELCIAGCV